MELVLVGGEKMDKKIQKELANLKKAGLLEKKTCTTCIY